MKRCSRCKKEHIILNFSKDRSRKDGINLTCKTCTRINGKKTTQRYKLRNLQEINREGNKTCSKCRISKTKDFFCINRTRVDGLHHQCKECVKEYQKNNNKPPKKYQKNDEGHQKKYYQDNRERLIANQKIYIYERLTKDEEFKLKTRLRSRILNALKTKGVKTYKRTKELIGCEILFLKEYLISNFFKKTQTKVSLTDVSRYGLHIDHIIPCDAFDLTNPEEQKKCFHYANLQLLPAAENLKKSNKMIGC